LAKHINKVKQGEIIRILADDPAASNDIPAWCRLRGQKYIGANIVDGVPAFDVRRLI
jgi:tRNA 2-thiouridine synthesizing protein A